MNANAEILIRAVECRVFLHVHGFLSDSENDKVWERIEKYKNQVRIRDQKKSPSQNSQGNRVDSSESL